MVSAANMSPVPEKNNGRAGVSMRKSRGLWSNVAVDPIIVRFSGTSSISGMGVDCWGSGDEEAGHDCGCEVAGSSLGDEGPEGAFELGFEGARDGVREGSV